MVYYSTTAPLSKYHTMNGSDSKYQLGGTVRHTLTDYTQFTPNDNVKIFVRAKPLIGSEDSDDVLQIPGIMKPTEDPDCTLLMRHPDTTRIVEDKFSFDRVFSGDCTQENIFDEVAKPLIRKVLEGYNGCIFSYGKNTTKHIVPIIDHHLPQQVKRGLVKRSRCLEKTLRN